MENNTAAPTPAYEKRWKALGVLSLSLLIIGLDNTILNVALPSLQEGLGANGSALQWIVDSYLLVFAGLLLTFGAFGDRFGRKLLLQLGVAIFGLSSLAVLFVDSTGGLIAVRSLMGVGGAMIMPSTLSIIANTFPRHERTKAIGIWSAFAAVGIGLGPLAGGLLLEWFSWRSVFLVNVPFAAVAFLLAFRLVPESRDPHPGKFDLPGAVLSIAGLLALVYTIIEAPNHGWLVPQTLGGFGLGLGLLALFVAWELRTAEPMLNLSYFRNPRFGIGAASVSLAYFALMGALYGLTQYLQSAHGYSAIEAGAVMTPLALGLMAGARSSTHLAERFGTTRFVAIGLTVVATMLSLALLWSPSTSAWALCPWFLVIAFGMGWVMAPSTSAVMGAVPEERSGVASAMNDVSRQVSGALGVAVIGSLITSLYTARIEDDTASLSPELARTAEESVGGAAAVAAGLPDSTGAALLDAAGSAYTSALGLSFVVAAVAAAAGALIAARFLPARPDAELEPGADASDLPPTPHLTQKEHTMHVNHPQERRDRGLARLVRACAGHPWRTFGIWLAIVVAVIGVSTAAGGKLVNNTTIPGSEAQAATDLLEVRFPEAAGDSAQVVFSSDEGMTSAEGREAVAAATAAAKEVPGVVNVGDPYAQKGGAISQDGTIGFMNVQFDKVASALDAEQIEQIQDDVFEATADSPVQVEIGGPVIDAEPIESHTAEAIGFGAAILVLLLVLGTALAMAVPILLAVISIMLGMSLLLLAAAFSDFHTITPILAVMIGLGVAIDYALFIVMRFRQELAKGKEPEDAAVVAGSTAGRAVIFAGATVAISISGLALVGIPFVAKMGYGTAIAVIVAVTTAVTLLPAVLAKLGHGIDRGRLPWAKRSTGESPHGLVARVAGLVARRPKLTLLATLAVLLTMAIPVASINMGTADAGTAPASTTKRQAYDLLAEGFGPGFNGPLLVAVDKEPGSDVAERLTKAFAANDGVAAVSPAVENEAGDTAQIAVYPTTSPQSEETSALVDELRDETIPAALAGTDAQAFVGGATAANEDIATKMVERFPLFLLFVMGIIALVLTMALRSVAIAIKAALTTSLSALAAFGALIAVFEWGWGLSLVGLDQTGPTASYLPVIVLSILFGLSMDYEVFLLSRIREEYVRGGKARAAVTDGVAGVGRVIFAAAIIMGVVFSAFMLTEDRTVKSFGLGLAVAILVDALIVRLLLVPAVMHLLGDKAWYMPRWLDRLLPNLTIEAPEEPEEESDEDDSDIDLPRAA